MSNSYIKKHFNFEESYFTHSNSTWNTDFAYVVLYCSPVQKKFHLQDVKMIEHPLFTVLFTFIIIVNKPSSFAK